jgi:glyoxylate/hydroxypyruvate reductase A
MEWDLLPERGPTASDFGPLLAAVEQALRARGWRLAAAESCTGGSVAQACTELAGSSEWFECGWVSYSNAAKQHMLGVPLALLQAHGAVSEPVARAMAQGALERSAADAVVALTGIAGPSGGSAEKPVGTVYLAWGSRVGGVQVSRLSLPGDRAAVRQASVRAAFEALRVHLEALPLTPVSTQAAVASVSGLEPVGRLSDAQGPEPVLFLHQMPAPEAQRWQAHLSEALAPHPVWSQAHWQQQPESARRVRVAVVANPPEGLLAQLPGLAFVQSLWAGVDKLLKDSTLPPVIPLARMVDSHMNEAMAQTALWAVLSLHRGFFGYARQQAQRVWRQGPQRRSDEVSVAVLGMGQMGGATARRLHALGYRVQGWRRQAPAAPGEPLPWVVHEGEAALASVLGGADIVVNLLPLTAATHGLLHAGRLAQMRPGAALVNLARGAHLPWPDLQEALNSGHVAHAVLDVFEAEPLPSDHPAWLHPQVTVLPHVAALTDPRSASECVARNVKTFLGTGLTASGEVEHRVDRQRGY